jgi:predicted membrane chloride channel (bestrophin family)
MEENFLRQLSMLRGEYFNIGDYNAGRMPMAYVQIMEVLVDTLNFLAPLALYTKMGAFNIISTGLLTLFFKGLLELSKSFLDPFGREGYNTHNIRVDVLVSELNFG